MGGAGQGSPARRVPRTEAGERGSLRRQSAWRADTQRLHPAMGRSRSPRPPPLVLLLLVLSLWLALGASKCRPCIHSARTLSGCRTGGAKSIGEVLAGVESLERQEGAGFQAYTRVWTRVDGALANPGHLSISLPLALLLPSFEVRLNQSWASLKPGTTKSLSPEGENLIRGCHWLSVAFNSSLPQKGSRNYRTCVTCHRIGL